MGELTCMYLMVGLRPYLLLSLKNVERGTLALSIPQLQRTGLTVGERMTFSLYRPSEHILPRIVMEVRMNDDDAVDSFIVDMEKATATLREMLAHRIVISDDVFNLTLQLKQQLTGVSSHMVSATVRELSGGVCTAVLHPRTKIAWITSDPRLTLVDSACVVESKGADECVRADDGIETTAAGAESEVAAGETARTLTPLPLAASANKEDKEDPLPTSMVAYTREFTSLRKDMRVLVRRACGSSHVRRLSMLLDGSPESGKTALVHDILQQTCIQSVHQLTAFDLLGLSDAAKRERIQQLWVTAAQSPASAIILDDLERLIEYDSADGRHSQPMLHALLVLLSMKPPEGQTMVVVGTSSMAKSMNEHNIEIVTAFGVSFEMPLMETAQEVRDVLQMRGMTETCANVFDSLREPIGIGRLLSMGELMGWDLEDLLRVFG